MFSYKSNTILSVPIKNRQAFSIKYARDHCYAHLQENRHAATLHIIDKECSNRLKIDFSKYNAAFQCVPPYIHCCNTSK